MARSTAQGSATENVLGYLARSCFPPEKNFHTLFFHGAKGVHVKDEELEITYPIGSSGKGSLGYKEYVDG